MKKTKNLVLFILAMTFLNSCSDSTTSKNGVPITPISCTTQCRIYMTQTASNGNLNGVAGADTICNSDSNKPSTGTYKALIMGSTRNQNMNWVLKANTPYYRPDLITKIGTTNSSRVFALATGLLDNSMDGTGFDSNWTGLIVTTDTVWTINNTCNDWADGTNASSGMYGDTVSTDRVSVGESNMPCNDPYSRLYCVEQ